MKRRHKNNITFNFNSLTDIVSNNLGILIIFTVIVSIFSLKNSELLPEILDSSKKKEKLIKIPWRHYSSQKALMLIFEGGRIFCIDEVSVFQKLLMERNKSQQDSLRVEFDSYFVSLKLLSNLPEYSVTIEPILLQGETVIEAMKETSKTNLFLKGYSPEKFYVYAFVRYDSFKEFNEMRDYFIDKEYSVGWSPVGEDGTYSYVFNKGTDIKNALLPQ